MPTNDIISFLRIADVTRRVGLSRSAVYSLIQRGLFPRPVRITGTRVSVWSSEAIGAWCQQQLDKE